MPHVYADRIMRRFIALYGVQKVTSMFGVQEDEIEEAKAMWEQQLRSVDPEIIRKTLESLAHTPREWPPNLSEWIALCKAESHHQQMRQAGALPAPKAEPTDFGRDMIGVIRESLGVEDPLYWAKRPKSAKAVEFLVMGAQRDNRLKGILQAHIENGGEFCRSDDARTAIMQLRTTP